MAGDGLGGTEKYLGQASNREDCKRMVRARERAANGATFSNGSGRGNCWAEFGMTSSSGGSSYQTCQFEGINLQSLYEGMIRSLGCFLAINFYPLLVTCFVTGDGIGGSEKYLGTASNREQCIGMVKAREPTANGATFPNSGGSGSCYAEFGMTGASSSSSWQTCRF